MTQPQPDQVNHIAQLLSARPERRWLLADLAAEAHLSPSQLTRLFTRRYGLSPMQFLAHTRARRLARLLTETDLPIGVAMARVGWASRGHAARQFKDLTGLTPSAYRALHHPWDVEPTRPPG